MLESSFANSGSVMDILSKKPNCSAPGMASASELKSGSVMQALNKGKTRKDFFCVEFHLNWRIVLIEIYEVCNLISIRSFWHHC